MGILAKSDLSDPDTVYDGDDDGYRESQDPAKHTHTVDRTFIKEWVANIAGYVFSEPFLPFRALAESFET